jgi:hypothetical protein
MEKEFSIFVKPNDDLKINKNSHDTHWACNVSSPGITGKKKQKQKKERKRNAHDACPLGRVKIPQTGALQKFTLPQLPAQGPLFPQTTGPRGAAGGPLPYQWAFTLHIR